MNLTIAQFDEEWVIGRIVLIYLAYINVAGAGSIATGVR